MNSQKSSQLLNDEKYIYKYTNNDDHDNSYINDEYLKSLVYVPKLYPSYCSERILTAEWCDGVKVNDLKSIKDDLGFNISSIMHTAVSLFGYQIFVTGIV
eukprot:363662_1